MGWGLKAALAGAGVNNAGLDPELMGLAGAEASFSAEPLIQKKYFFCQGFN